MTPVRAEVRTHNGLLLAGFPALDENSARLRAERFKAWLVLKGTDARDVEVVICSAENHAETEPTCESSYCEHTATFDHYGAMLCLRCANEVRAVF